jgi:hypothetical protein
MKSLRIIPCQIKLNVIMTRTEKPHATKNRFLSISMFCKCTGVDPLGQAVISYLCTALVFVFSGRVEVYILKREAVEIWRLFRTRSFITVMVIGT